MSSSTADPEAYSVYLYQLFCGSQKVVSNAALAWLSWLCHWLITVRLSPTRDPDAIITSRASRYSMES